jgi:hypothetical protein
MKHAAESGGNLLLNALLRESRSLCNNLERVTCPLGSKPATFG